MSDSVLSDFDKILPAAITTVAVRTPAGNEWVIPFPEAKQAINLATKNLIAVLGVESFQILEAGLGVDNYSGYSFDHETDWPTYVQKNNEAARQFIEEHQLGTGYGYILTTTSEPEFRNLPSSSRA